MFRIAGLILGGIFAALLLALLGIATMPRNPLGWFLVFAALVYCLGGSINMARELYGASHMDKAGEERGNITSWLLAPGMIGSLFVSALDYSFLPAGLPRTDAMIAAGGILVIVGMGLRLWVRITLRRAYSFHLRVPAGQPLVRHGLYRWLRHPSYLAIMLYGLGLAVGYSSWLGLLFTFAVMLPAVVYRIHVEERMLQGAFGEEYRQYMGCTHRLLPGIW